MTGEEFFLANRAEIERAVRFEASRARLSPEDAEDLQSAVNLRLIENDYAVIRNFKGGCAFATYIVTIARHILADQRMHDFGRFRPSAEAKRLGDPGILLEQLLYRDQKAFDEALAIVLQHHAVTREEVVAMAARLRPRSPRPRAVSIDEVVEPAIDPDTVEKPAIDHEREARAAAINRIVDDALSRIPLQERLAFRLRLRVPPVSGAEIARMLHLDQKRLYRRLEAIEKRLGKVLRDHGVTRQEILDLTDGTGSQLDFNGHGPETIGSCQPIDARGSGDQEVPE